MVPEAHVMNLSAWPSFAVTLLPYNRRQPNKQTNKQTDRQTDRQMTERGDILVIIHPDTPVTVSKPTPQASDEAPCILVPSTQCTTNRPPIPHY